MKFRHFLPAALFIGLIVGAAYARAQLWAPISIGTPNVGAASWSLISTTGAASANTSSVTTSPISTLGADQIEVVSAVYSEGPTPTISDSAGNTWILDSQTLDSISATYLSFWRAQSPVNTSASHTFTVSANFPAVAVAAFSGSNGGTYDVIATNTAGSGSTTLSTGSVTPSQNNSLILSGLAVASSGALPITETATSPMTMASSVPFVVAVNLGVALSYYIQPTAGAINPNFTWGPFTGPAQGATVVYKP